MNTLFPKLLLWAALLTKLVSSADIDLKLRYSATSSSQGECERAPWNPSLPVDGLCPPLLTNLCTALDLAGYDHYHWAAYQYPCLDGTSVDLLPFTSYYAWLDPMTGLWNYVTLCGGFFCGHVPWYLDVGLVYNGIEVVDEVPFIQSRLSAGMAIEHASSPPRRRFYSTSTSVGTTLVHLESPFVTFDGQTLSLSLTASCDPQTTLMFSMVSSPEIFDPVEAAFICERTPSTNQFSTIVRQYGLTDATFCLATDLETKCHHASISTDMPCLMSPNAPCTSMFCYLGARSFTCLTAVYKMVIAILALVASLLVIKITSPFMIAAIAFLYTTNRAVRYILSPLGGWLQYVLNCFAVAGLDQNATNATLASSTMENKPKDVVFLTAPPKYAYPINRTRGWYYHAGKFIVVMMVGGARAESLLRYWSPSINDPVGYPSILTTSTYGVESVVNGQLTSSMKVSLSFSLPDKPGNCLLFRGNSTESTPISLQVCLTDAVYLLGLHSSYVAYSYHTETMFAAECPRISQTEYCKGLSTYETIPFAGDTCRYFCEPTSGPAKGCFSFAGTSVGGTLVAFTPDEAFQVLDVTAETPKQAYYVRLNYTDATGPKSWSGSFEGHGRLELTNHTGKVSPDYKMESRTTVVKTLESHLGDNKLYIPFSNPSFMGALPFPHPGSVPARGFAAAVSSSLADCVDLNWSDDLVSRTSTHSGTAGKFRSQHTVYQTPLTAAHVSSPAYAAKYSALSPVLFNPVLSGPNLLPKSFYRGDGSNHLQVSVELFDFPVTLTIDRTDLRISAMRQLTTSIGKTLSSSIEVVFDRSQKTSLQTLKFSGNFVPTTAPECIITAGSTGPCIIPGTISETTGRVKVCNQVNCISETFSYDVDSVFVPVPETPIDADGSISPEDYTLNTTGLEIWEYAAIVAGGAVAILSVFFVYKYMQSKKAMQGSEKKYR